MSISDRDRALRRAFRFDAADLAANRAGRVSPRQDALLRAGRLGMQLSLAMFAIRLEQRNRARRPAGGAKHLRLPGIANRQPERRPVTDDAGDRRGQVMQVDDDAPDSRAVQAAKDARDERVSGHGQGRLRAHRRQRL
jgi:hypothetical protein